ncbi:MAG: amino acid ABC transporter permease [Firmicutes bacterium]|nr:amino acid ABC transporter permease [Bacillota bacterium]
MNRFDLGILISSFFELAKALPLTLSVGILAMLIGLILGTSISVYRYLYNGPLNKMLAGYISFFRGTPLMIQLFLFFFGLPQIMPLFGRMNAFQASVLIMGINASAYVAESIRAALSSIDSLQHDAGLSIGLNRYQSMWYILLPQAMRVALPTLGNTFIGVIQGTSLTFMLGLNDLMGLAKMRAASNYRFFEVYLAVGLMYWLITILLSKLNDRMAQKLKGEAN